jgi:hypothetical protein
MLWHRSFLPSGQKGIDTVGLIKDNNVHVVVVKDVTLYTVGFS